MQIVTIPFDYDALSPLEKAEIVPICIRDTDERGDLIDWGWIEAAARIQDPLRALARSRLHDVWRVSEITEAAVHSLWNNNGRHLGLYPSRRVYTAAKWQAQERRSGNPKSRRRILVALDGLERVVRERVLVDPANYGRVYEDELYFKELGARLQAEGLSDVSEMLKLIRDGCTWDEIGLRMGKRPDAARMRFHRRVNKLFLNTASDLGRPHS